MLTMALIKSNDGPLPAPTALGSSAVPVRQRGGRAGLGGVILIFRGKKEALSRRGTLNATPRGKL